MNWQLWPEKQATGMGLPVIGWGTGPERDGPDPALQQPVHLPHELRLCATPAPTHGAVSTSLEWNCNWWDDRVNLIRRGTRHVASPSKLRKILYRFWGESMGRLCQNGQGTRGSQVPRHTRLETEGVASACISSL